MFLKSATNRVILTSFLTTLTLFEKVYIETNNFICILSLTLYVSGPQMCWKIWLLDLSLLFFSTTKKWKQTPTRSRSSWRKLWPHHCEWSASDLSFSHSNTKRRIVTSIDLFYRSQLPQTVLSIQRVQRCRGRHLQDVFCVYQKSQPWFERQWENFQRFYYFMHLGCIISHKMASVTVKFINVLSSSAGEEIPVLSGEADQVPWDAPAPRAAQEPKRNGV